MSTIVDILLAFSKKVSDEFKVEISDDVWDSSVKSKPKSSPKIVLDSDPVFRKSVHGNLVWKTFVIDKDTNVIIGTENVETGEISDLTSDQVKFLEEYKFTVKN